jgi:hypothetical protein
VIEGTIAAFTDPSTLDMSVLGRDIMMYHFALIVERQQEVVCLLGPGHRCKIQPG